MSCSFRETYIVVTAVLFRCSVLWSPFPSRCVSSPVCSQTRLFRNEPRLRSVVNPSHQWLAPREPGCWGVSHSLAFFLPLPSSASRYSFIKAEPETVPNRPQRRTGQPRRRSSRVCQQQRPWAANALTDKQVVSRQETQLTTKRGQPRASVSRPYE